MCDLMFDFVEVQKEKSFNPNLSNRFSLIFDPVGETKQFRDYCHCKVYCSYKINNRKKTLKIGDATFVKIMDDPIHEYSTTFCLKTVLEDFKGSSLYELKNYLKSQNIYLVGNNINYYLKLHDKICPIIRHLQQEKAKSQLRGPISNLNEYCDPIYKIFNGILKATNDCMQNTHVDNPLDRNYFSRQNVDDPKYFDQVKSLLSIKKFSEKIKLSKRYTFLVFFGIGKFYNIIEQFKNQPYLFIKFTLLIKNERNGYGFNMLGTFVQTLYSIYCHCHNKLMYSLNADMIFYLNKVYNSLAFVNKSSIYVQKDRLKKICSNNVSRIANAVLQIRKVLQIKTYNELWKLGNDLGQFTSLRSIPYLFNDNEHSLRFTNIKQLNDPSESKVIFELFPPLKKYNKELSTNNSFNKYYAFPFLFVSSACLRIKSNTNLPMWNQYADESRGVFLVYSEKFLRKIIENTSANIYRVCYIKKESKKSIKCIVTNDDPKCKRADKIKSYSKIIKSQLNCIMNKSKNHEYERYLAYELINSISFLFKKTDYSYESEIRIVQDSRFPDCYVEAEKGKALTTRAPKMYSYVLDLHRGRKLPVTYKEVILGPRSCSVDFIGPYVSYFSGSSNKQIRISNETIQFR